MLHTYKDDLATMFSGLKRQIKRTGSDMVESAKNTLASFAHYKAPSWAVAPIGEGYVYAPIDFNFAKRYSSALNDLEEAERARRIAVGPNPIVSGLWHKLGLELKYKYSLRPTLASAAATVASVASDVANATADIVGKAGEFLGDLAGSVQQKSKDLIEEATPVVPQADYIVAEHPSNLFAYTAQPIDFTFKSRRCPQWILDAEEAERSRRLNTGVDVLGYSKWNNLLSAPHKTLLNPVVPRVAPLSSYLPSFSSAKSAVGGYLSSWAHTLSDTAASYMHAAKDSDVVEAVKDSYDAAMDTTSIAAVNKAEEAERLRRLNNKIDPMMAARVGRINDEVHRTVNSV